MSYTFRWDKPASDVYVTGTFDDWSKSVKLDKEGDVFQKTVDLPTDKGRIDYKFVVDGEWTTSDAKSEKDESGNVNNYLDASDLSSPTHPTISSAAPRSSTTAMAGAVPLEDKASASAPGAFPETPANEEQSFSVNPIPASEGQGNPMQLAPGEKVPDSSANARSIESGVHDDPELKAKDEEANRTMGVAPIPASEGLGNPIQLAPGEPVPDSKEISGHSLDSTAKMDQASYEKSDAGVQPVQPDPKTDPVAAGLGPQTSSQIPESSMGMGSDAPADISKEDTGPMISSVAPMSSTAAMAGQVPKEERREATVVDEDKTASDPTISSVAPTSSTAAMAGQVTKEERAEPTVIDGEKEPVKSADSDNRGFMGTLAAAAGGGGAAMDGGAYAANEMAKEKTGTDPKSSLPESAQKTVDDNALASTASIPQQSAAGEAPTVPKEGNNLTSISSVPEEVTKSQKEAQFPPEAAANTEAVDEKKEVEEELLNKVPESNATGEPAPTESAAAATTAPVATTDAPSSSGAPQLGDPTAGVAALSMDDKAKTDNLEPKKDESKPLDSRDVSPMSKSPTNQPEVTTGTSTSKTATESTPTPRPQKDTENSTPVKRQSMMDRMRSGSASGTPASAKSRETSDSKKEKRKSLFGRIKEKLKN